MAAYSPYNNPIWNIEALKVKEAREIANSKGEYVNVAILDTGINYLLDPIKERFDLQKLGYDFVSGNSNVPAANPNIHGTLVARILADCNFGIAPGVNLYSLKVCDHPPIRNKRVIQALNWCMKNQIDIVNMSFGGPIYDHDFHEKCSQLHSNGIILIAAAGNHETGAHFPASFNEAVISVAAVDPYIGHCKFSNVWPTVDISSPGLGFYPINEPNPHSGTENQGTSFSAPQIAGMLSIGISMLKKNGKSTDPTELERVLKETAYDLSDEEAIPDVMDQWIDIYDPERVLFDQSEKGTRDLLRCMYGAGMAQADKFVLALKRIKNIE